MDNNKMRKYIKRIKRYIENFGYYEFSIFVVFIVLAGIICIHHELSQDEAQSFLIAKNLSYIDIIKHMKYEGHSFLWHFLISPIAKLDLYPDLQKVIPYIFSVLTVYLILKKSPFGKITKTLLVFSPGILYYYSSFARPYCMIPFFLVSLAILYKDRYKHPYKYSILLGLLANTHMIMLPVVYIISFCYYFNLFRRMLKKEYSKTEKRNILVSFIIFSFLFMIIIIMSILGYFNCHILDISVAYKDIDDILKNFFKLSYESIDRIIATFYGYVARPMNLTGTAPKYYYFLFIVWFLLLVVSTIKIRKNFLVFWLELCFIVFIHAIFWFILPVRAHLITYTLMYWAWIYYDENKKENCKILSITLAVLILLTIPGNYKLVYEDINKDYSSAKETSNYIRNNIKKGSTFFVLYYDFSQLLSLYLGDDYKFYYPNSERYQTFIKWDDKAYVSMNINNTVKKITSEKKKRKKTYILIPKVSNEQIYSKENLEFILDLKLNKIYKSNKKNMINNKYVFDMVLFEIYETNYNVSRVN